MGSWPSEYSRDVSNMYRSAWRWVTRGPFYRAWFTLRAWFEGWPEFWQLHKAARLNGGLVPQDRGQPPLLIGGLTRAELDALTEVVNAMPTSGPGTAAPNMTPVFPVGVASTADPGMPRVMAVGMSPDMARRLVYELRGLRQLLSAQITEHRCGADHVPDLAKIAKRKH